MVALVIPLTREAYLRERFENPELPLDAEIEESIPEPFRLPNPSAMQHKSSQRELEE